MLGISSNRRLPWARKQSGKVKAEVDNCSTIHSGSKKGSFTLAALVVILLTNVFAVSTIWFAPLSSASAQDIVPTFSSTQDANPPYSGETLDDVSCPIVNFCMAVGVIYESYGTYPYSNVFYDQYSEIWNGSEWSRSSITTDPTGGVLNGVSCPQANWCMVVGYEEGTSFVAKPAAAKPAAYIWQPSGWSTSPFANNSSDSILWSVSCASKDFCLALGQQPGPTLFSNPEQVALEWQGTSWSSIPIPSGVLFESVSCSSDSFCMALGHINSQSVSEVWNRASWTPTAQQPPQNYVGATVSCINANYCVIGVGDTPYGASALVWDGASWSVFTAQFGGYDQPINSISCANRNFCILASYQNIYFFNGSSINDISVSYGTSYLGASCASSSACVVVGGINREGLVVSSWYSNIGSKIIGAIGAGYGGYTEISSDGGVFTFGNAEYYGPVLGISPNDPVVGTTSSPNINGYWLATASGKVFALGNTGYYGSLHGTTLNSPIVGIASSPDGKGYWLVGQDGGVFAYGDANFEGSLHGTTLNSPIVGIASSPDGKGYWLVGQDGGVFAYGDAPFLGSKG